MLKEVSLRIPEAVYHQASWLAKGRDEQLEDVLVKAIDIESLARKMVVDLSEADEGLDREQEAYEQMHEELKRQYLGQSVALKGGKLIDMDVDYGTLYERVLARYPDESVWMTTVRNEAIPTLMMRSPRWERKAK
jgi:hypothetical protein